MYATFVNSDRNVTDEGADSERDSERDDSESERSEDGEERRAEESHERSGRFVETRHNPEVFKIKQFNQGNQEMAPFYNGVTLEERMAEVRSSIYYIRQNWGKRHQFMEELKHLLQDGDGLEFEEETTRAHCVQLFSSDRDWLTQEKAQPAELNYEAVKLYTSKDGHKKIYRIANYIFRQKGDVSPEIIRCIVFLVELINIDLFNYCLKFPGRSDFQGTVYRGMGVTDEDLDAFKAMREEPINKRNVAVPLGLFASSSSIKVAKKFIRQTLKGSSLHPLMLKIHVISLKQEYVNIYRDRFPGAELTTICAVDIHEISRFPKEKEVLLRGPFMVILNFYEDENMRLLGQPCNVVEAVMLNANRDHISTSHLGDLDARARDIFGAMVSVTRNEYAREYCKKNGLVDDAHEYTKAFEDSITKLNAVLEK
ncbi:hypothetical protein MAR_002320 [Mya arenaria]|uniref:Uncharacterized protein n=1 Tax=Mya arenaria TaxID=6604 RepID=A0ABY7FEC9_MYAAR|nr:uncharacterized protein LOC128209678 [Mya arenaria]WAR20482.1 hypothetical protein MAR_002320 [Mya arenaria]